MNKINDKEVLKRLGQNIRQVRKSKGLTLEDVAAHSGVDTSDIGKIERGEINLAFTTLCKIALGLEENLTVLVNIDIH